MMCGVSFLKQAAHTKTKVNRTAATVEILVDVTII